MNKNETVMVKSYCTLIQWQFIYFFYLFVSLNQISGSRNLCGVQDRLYSPLSKKKKRKKKEFHLCLISGEEVVARETQHFRDQ